VEYIQVNEKMHRFRKEYQNKKISSNFDVLNQKYVTGEIVLCTLWATDGSNAHAVCICNHKIFDSNCQNALDLNLNSLNACCVGNFQKIKTGYYFHQRFIVQDVLTMAKLDQQQK
jgi:hypothetical protein